MRTNYTTFNKSNTRYLNIQKIVIVFFVVCMTFASIHVNKVYAEAIKEHTESLIYSNPDLKQTYEKYIRAEGILPYSYIRGVIENIEKMPDWVWTRFIEHGTVDLVKYIDVKSDIPGFEDSLTIGLYWENPASRKIKIDWSDHGVENATLHEFGHYVDIGVYNSISSTEEFQNIYNLEKNYFYIMSHNKYAVSTVTEYFAEAFQFFYDSDESEKSLREHCPETWNFIYELMY